MTRPLAGQRERSCRLVFEAIGYLTERDAGQRHRDGRPPGAYVTPRAIAGRTGLTETEVICALHALERGAIVWERANAGRAHSRIILDGRVVS